MKNLLIVAIIASGISLITTSCEPEIIGPVDQNDSDSTNVNNDSTDTLSNPDDNSNVNDTINGGNNGGSNDADSTWVFDNNTPGDSTVTDSTEFGG